MTEPTRDALHEATLLALDTPGVRSMMTREEVAHAAACVRQVAELEAEVALLRETGQRMFDERNEACANLNDARAELCELRAEVERLRAKAAIVDAIDSGAIAVRRWAGGTIEIAKDVGGVAYEYYTGPSLLAAYAAATREGTDATNA